MRTLSNEKGTFAADENAVNAYKSTLSGGELGLFSGIKVSKSSAYLTMCGESIRYR